MKVASNDVDLWCILRTAGPRTLRVADALAARGFETWTPRRTFKREKPGRKSKGHRITVEAQAPILPTFVFARAPGRHRLLALSNDPHTTLPAFSVFQHAGRVPLVGDREVAGLMQAEADAEAAIQRERDAETRAEAQRRRAEAMGAEKARRRALRAERRELRPGQAVTVADMPALTGMPGVVESSDGRTAMVVFGKLLTMKIEAWQLITDDIYPGRS